MPNKPLKPCKHLGCPVLSYNVYCDKHRPKPTYDERRPNATDRGYDSKWRAARAAFLKDNPICIYCGGPSNTVHHDPPHRGDMHKFWDRSSWRAACSRCNSRIGVLEEGGLGR